MVSLIHSLKDCIPKAYCGRQSLDSKTAVGLAGSVAHINNGQSYRLISIMVSLIHSLLDCMPEAHCGRLSLDSRTAVKLAGTVAHIHNGYSNHLPNGLYTRGVLWQTVSG